MYNTLINWFLLNAKWVFFQLYHWREQIRGLDMSLYSDILSRLRGKRYLLSLINSVYVAEQQHSMRAS
jgi:hypothetical protein